MSETTRRQVLAGAAGASAALVLAACGSGEDTQVPVAQPAAAQAAPAPAVLRFAKTSDIPVNGGKIFPDQNVIVTQPTAGQFKAFSATCTHKGCALASIEKDVIVCKCHGARFAVADGSVQKGPATSPLRPMNIRVDGGAISLI